MSTVNPTTPTELARLDELHAAATAGDWQRHPSPKKWVLLPIPEDADPNNDANANWCVAAHNAYPALRARIAELEAENTCLQASIDETLDAIRDLDRESLFDWLADLGGDEVLAQWLAARDARLKAEGAAEWLENFVLTLRHDDPTSSAVYLDSLMQEAAALRERAK